MRGLVGRHRATGCGVPCSPDSRVVVVMAVGTCKLAFSSSSVYTLSDRTLQCHTLRTDSSVAPCRSHVSF